MKRAVASLLVVFALALSGVCVALAGSPCQVITQKDAEAILGEAVKPGRESNLGGVAAGRSCRYFTAAPLAKRGMTGSVSLSIYDAATMKQGGGVFTSPEKYFQRRKEVLGKQKNSKLEEISGLGDGAFWLAKGDDLHLMHKGVYYVLSIKDMAKISSSKGMDDLQAKLAAHRLKLCQDAARKYILK